MAESDPSTQSGSDVDLEQIDAGEVGFSQQRQNSAKGGHKRLGSVRALAIKKVTSPAHPLLYSIAYLAPN